MDPNSGRIYESFTAAQMAGVTNPVEVQGSPEAIAQMSQAVAHWSSMSAKAKRRAAGKAARKARRANR